VDRDGHLNPSEFRAMLLEDVHPDEVRRPVRATHARTCAPARRLARSSVRRIPLLPPL
jgi:hypothetical protein